MDTQTPSDDKGIEQLPSGKFRVKLRDPTGARKWMPGGGPFATREEAVRYRRGVLAILADATADNILPQEPVRIAAELLRDTSPHRARRAVLLALSVLNPVVGASTGADSADSADSSS